MHSTLIIVCRRKVNKKARRRLGVEILFFLSIIIVSIISLSTPREKK